MRHGSPPGRSAPGCHRKRWQQSARDHRRLIEGRARKRPGGRTATRDALPGAVLGRRNRDRRGRSAMVAVIDPVRHLAVTPFADYATVSWEWPERAARRDHLGTRRRDGRAQLDQPGPVPVRGRRPGSRSAAGRAGRGPRRDHGRRHHVHVAAGGAVVTDGVVTRSDTVSAPVTRTVRRAGKKVTFTADQGCSGRPGPDDRLARPVMPTRPRTACRCWRRLCLPPGVPAEHRVTSRAVKKPYWVRCFVIGGPARLIDPPVASIKEN